MKLPDYIIKTGGCGNPACPVCKNSETHDPLDIDEVLNEIKIASQSGIKEVFFPDHELLTHPGRPEIISALKRSDIKFVISTIDRVIPSEVTLLKLMKLGLSGMRLWFFSVRPEVLQLHNITEEFVRIFEEKLTWLKRTKLPFQVHVPITKYNLGEVDQTILEIKRKYQVEAKPELLFTKHEMDLHRIQHRIARRMHQDYPQKTGEFHFNLEEKNIEFDVENCPIKSGDSLFQIPQNSTLVKTVTQANWQKYTTVEDKQLEVIRSKNILGLVSIINDDGAKICKLHGSCKRCPKLAECGACFIAENCVSKPQELPDDFIKNMSKLHDVFKDTKENSITISGHSAVCRLSDDSKHIVENINESIETWEAVDIARLYEFGVVDYELDRNPINGNWRITFEKNAESLQKKLKGLAVLQISSACVARCIMCTLPVMFSGKWVDTRTSVRFIEEIYLLGYGSCDIFGGEITLRQDFVSLVKYAKIIGLRTLFITTGYNLNSRKIKELADAGVDKCSIALESAEPDIHDEIKSREGLHKEAVKAINAIVDDGRIPLEINTALTTKNVDELPELVKLLADLKVERHRIFYIVDMLWGMGEVPYLTYEQALNFVENTHPEIEKLSKNNHIHLDWCPPIELGGDKQKQAEMLSKGQYTDPNVTCKAPEYELYLTVEGKIYPCVNPSIWRDIEIANVEDGKLVDIIKRDKFQEFRRNAGSMPSCTNCISKRTE